MTTPVDTPVPLATVEQFTTSPFADLAKGLQPGQIDQVMLEATRLCEDACDGRRLAPFTITETQRASAIDPDEFGAGMSGVPMSMAGTLGVSYASALGASDLVRHIWLDHYAHAYPDLWTPYTINSLTVMTSYGSTAAGNVVQGPDVDSGHVWFQLGQFIPVGSWVTVNYSGGYSTVPANLVRAGKLMAAYNILTDLDPQVGTQYDPMALYDQALTALGVYMPQSARARRG